MKKQHDEEILENLDYRQLQQSEQLETLQSLYIPDTVPPRQCVSREVHQRGLLSKGDATVEPCVTWRSNRSPDAWPGFSWLVSDEHLLKSGVVSRFTFLNN